MIGLIKVTGVTAQHNDAMPYMVTKVATGIL